MPIYPKDDERARIRNANGVLAYEKQHQEAIEKKLQNAAEELVDVVEERDRLRTALDESVRLQSHYAMLLNMHDGGKRIEFADAEAWLERLARLLDVPIDPGLQLHPDSALAHAGKEATKFPHPSKCAGIFEGAKLCYFCGGDLEP